MRVSSRCFGKQLPTRSNFVATDHVQAHHSIGTSIVSCRARSHVLSIYLFIFLQLTFGISSLLSDYACYVLPNAPKTLLGGHKGNVKCVEFVGEEGNLIASGSSDNTVRLWSAEDGRCVRILSGHTSRVWSVASSRAGNLLITASGDATACVRLQYLRREEFS